MGTDIQNEQKCTQYRQHNRDLQHVIVVEIGYNIEKSLFKGSHHHIYEKCLTKNWRDFSFSSCFLPTDVRNVAFPLRNNSKTPTNNIF